MQVSDIKTIHVTISKWFDKANGNTYFSGFILINNQERIFIPFTYGYDRFYEEIVFQKIKQLTSFKQDLPLWKFVKENNISYTENVYFSLKREMIKE
jgi:hypothetical protein